MILLTASSYYCVGFSGRVKGERVKGEGVKGRKGEGVGMVLTEEISSKQNTRRGRFDTNVIGYEQRFWQNLPPTSGTFFLRNLLIDRSD